MEYFALALIPPLLGIALIWFFAKTFNTLPLLTQDGVVLLTIILATTVSIVWNRIIRAAHPRRFYVYQGIILFFATGGFFKAGALGAFRYFTGIQPFKTRPLDYRFVPRAFRIPRQIVPPHRHPE